MLNQKSLLLAFLLLRCLWIGLCLVRGCGGRKRWRFAALLNALWMSSLAEYRLLHEVRWLVRLRVLVVVESSNGRLELAWARVPRILQVSSDFKHLTLCRFRGLLLWFRRLSGD